MRRITLQVTSRLGRWPVLFLGFGAALLVLAFANSCATTPRIVVVPSDIPGARYVGNQACLPCHTNYVRQYPASAHARMYFVPEAKAGPSGCEACHGPGSKHVEIGGGRGKFILNPGRKPEACFQCHLETHAEFTLPQHHPVVEGKMNCVQCHDPHGMDIMKPAGGLALSRLNQTCAQCHREQTKPFVFEHEAMREGCMVCHNPHGSINEKMLIESDNNLCLRCHAQLQGPNAGQMYIGRINHATYLKLGGCWSAGCHTAVHGSNFSPRQFY